jgi:cytidyltransferase-like protein
VGEILDLDDLSSRVSDDRRRGLTVAFANGCFDLLHVGHTRYLRAAATEADRLIVAVNGDESVRAQSCRRLTAPSWSLRSAEWTTS